MDCLKKAISQDKSVVFLAVDATQLVNESLQRTQAWPPSILHLGQGFLASSLLMALTSKEDSSQISLQWNTGGPFGTLFVESNFEGKSRGVISHPRAEVNNLTTPLGSGTFCVRRNSLGKNISTGIVEASGNVCDDALEYLRSSEQRNCAMNLWVDLQWNDGNEEKPFFVNKAIGYLMELLPKTGGAKQAAQSFFWEERLQELKSLSSWSFAQNEDITSQILQQLSGEENIKEIFYQGLSFHCQCSEERAKSALAIAIEQEKKEVVLKEKIENFIKCEFCGKEYEVKS